MPLLAKLRHGVLFWHRTLKCGRRCSNCAKWDVILWPTKWSALVMRIILIVIMNAQEKRRLVDRNTVSERARNKWGVYLYERNPPLTSLMTYSCPISRLLSCCYRLCMPAPVRLGCCSKIEIGFWTIYKKCYFWGVHMDIRLYRHQCPTGWGPKNGSMFHNRVNELRCTEQVKDTLLIYSHVAASLVF